MKTFTLILLLVLFLPGCRITSQEQIWNLLDIGEKATFKMLHRHTDENRYYRLERISKEKI